MMDGLEQAFRHNRSFKSIERHVYNILDREGVEYLFKTYTLKQLSPFSFIDEVIKHVNPEADNTFIKSNIAFWAARSGNYILANSLANEICGITKLTQLRLLLGDKVDRSFVISNLTHFGKYVIEGNNINLIRDIGKFPDMIYPISTIELMAEMRNKISDKFLVQSVYRYGTEEMINIIDQEFDKTYNFDRLIGAVGHSIDRIKRLLPECSKLMDNYMVALNSYFSRDYKVVKFVEDFTSYNSSHMYDNIKLLVPETIDEIYDITAHDLSSLTEDIAIKLISKFENWKYNIQLLSPEIILPVLKSLTE